MAHVFDNQALIDEVKRHDDALQLATRSYDARTDVRVYNGNCAVLIADLHQHYDRGEKTVDAMIRYTDTWVLLSGSKITACVSNGASPVFHP